MNNTNPFPRCHFHQAVNVYTACAAYSRALVAPRRTEDYRLVTCKNCLSSKEYRNHVKELAG